MKGNKTKKWSIGLQFVQFQKNSSHHRVIGRSSYKALFGNDPKVGLATSSLLIEILQILVTEEDLEEIYKEDIQKCHMETDSAEAILCNLCEKNMKIKEARHLGAIEIEKQAEKMLQDNKIKIPTFKVGDCIVIPVPKVDRGPTDPANIIAVVIDQKNDLNRIGTEHGVLKGWYGSGNIQSATSNFIDIEQVNKTKEMSLREIVSSLTGGQGFFSCYCKGKC
ncbi:uncharacterized protein LOC112597034 [Melanaphis sacchari]|uniref:uncharacterized protein LOC112597034 n=1 Tax=Melanaphis sacchari TaxID=742174 RepID=UPI000DC153F2|nr:uncharacterized protein LOC112597034 [Melanaphis sacchari]